jgi:hypothetical protein
MVILAAVRCGLVLLASLSLDGFSVAGLRKSTVKTARILKGHRKSLLRCLGWMARIFVREHEIVALGTNITDEAWEAYSTSGTISEPVIFYMTTNPRRPLTQPKGDILAYTGEEPHFIIVSDGTTSNIDTANPIPYICETW